MDEIHSIHPSNLASLFQSDERAAQSWTGEEMGDVLRHQLDAPLLTDLKSASSAGSPGQPLISFRDVLRHPSPPLELLKQIKEFAKSGGAALPKEVATVLYYAAIVLARSRHGVSITTLTDEAQHTGLRWALQQPWLDAEVRGIFEEVVK